MATAYHNLSDYDYESVPSGKGLRIGIAVAEWNRNITEALMKGAIATLLKHDVTEEDIIVQHVPGTFELTYASAYLAEQHEVDAVIAIGCVVRGDTPHFDYICQGVTQGITQLNVDGFVPVIFGVLTTETMLQAEERAGGKHGNKGTEAAVTALKMAGLRRV
ncbi:6,7-dimethyl-8-ribityllumazine synthase [Porphyromonas gulae]|uniref:6,7-dimethyl-8-ribityllumazine synthase n=1 Tax=Porphyromonas gulae TaxID=111105 RepID=A0A099WSK5_9PORP|nr:6,7-dimethyl-8-ribityllumazine synthase [Porphyromonas gulae]KGL47070.1 6,7-dimethyl-8-ribityllumazine synthase [Porphyromonas gulae]KGN69428.1 6,7-dimethyl-8-ribityllumazine synthase [Porphyromonas gulae]KGN73042.1 6,7-dimethyl-8-ribityllumazine synthase [Porphyromonas gulae]KGN79809.1 6,7-dimethyl-8-ribityllumazine synthase [Porphyromonas gulae]KGN86612.1 6,7-dimethyl-8-ribityllumazine synthase [Porphyromonas gulae]